MELRPLDKWFLQHDEPVRSCLQFLRSFILAKDKGLIETWKYSMPVYCYNGKMFCYLWFHKKYKQPYIGFVEGHAIEHPDLLAEKRARMKILLLDPSKNIPVRKLDSIFKQLFLVYK